MRGRCGVGDRRPRAPHAALPLLARVHRTRSEDRDHRGGTSAPTTGLLAFADAAFAEAVPREGDRHRLFPGGLYLTNYLAPGRRRPSLSRRTVRQRSRSPARSTGASSGYSRGRRCSYDRAIPIFVTFQCRGGLWPVTARMPGGPGPSCRTTSNSPTRRRACRGRRRRLRRRGSRRRARPRGSHR